MLTKQRSYYLPLSAFHGVCPSQILCADSKAKRFRHIRGHNNTYAYVGVEPVQILWVRRIDTCNRPLSSFSFFFRMKRPTRLHTI